MEIPRGSKFPTGSRAPGSQKSNSDSSGTQPFSSACREVVVTCHEFSGCGPST